MTELELKHVQEQKAAEGPLAPASARQRARDMSHGRALLSIPDTYSVSLLNRTVRRETPLPGTDRAADRVPDRASDRVPDRRTAPLPSPASKAPASRAPGSKVPEPGIPASKIPASKVPGSLRYPQPSPVTARLAGPAEQLHAEVRNRSRSRKVQTNRSFLLRFLAAICLICSVAAVLTLALPRLTKIERIRIEGLSNLSEQVVLEALGPVGSESLLTLDLKAMEERLQRNPRIARARLYRLLPSTLGVDIAERAAVAGVLLDSGQNTRIALIDAEGVAFAEVDPADTVVPSLPILSGIRFAQFQAGQRLPEMLIPLMQDLGSLHQTAPELLSAFSELKIDRISGSGAELVLYPVHVKTTVRMPLRLDPGTLRTALVVLDILRSRGMGDQPSEIDFRTGAVVYRMKEAASD